MGFDEVWQYFRQLVGRRFHTLDQRKPFTLIEVSNSNLTVRVEESGKTRPIQRSHFEEAWQRLTTFGRLTRSEIHRDISPFNPAYVSTLLAQVPGVQYRVSPIMLMLNAPAVTIPASDRAKTGQVTVEEPEEDDEAPGLEEVEETIADKLAVYGRKLGFEARQEWQTDTGNRIDLVWAREMPTNFPGLSDKNLIPIVGFEIETSLRSRKHVKGDIFNLQDLSPSLGVIVLCRGSKNTPEQVESLRVAAKRYINKLGLRMLVWSDADVDRLVGSD